MRLRTQSALIDALTSRTAAAQLLALVDQGCLSASTFGTTALIARTAGLEALGTFSVVWMVVLLVNAAQGAIVTAPMASLAPSEHGSAADYYAHYVRLELRLIGMLVLISAAVLIVVFATSSWAAPIVGSGVAAVVGYQLYDFIRRLTHVAGRHSAAATVSAVTASTQLTALAILGSKGLLTAPVALFAASACMGATATIAAALVVPRWLPRRDDLELGRRHWESSRWLLGSALMQWTCGNLFLMLSPSFVGLWATGALRAAQSLVGIANIWHHGLENVIPSHAGRLWRQESPWHAVLYVGRVTLIWTLVTAAFVGTVIVYADELLLAVYGPEIAAYGWVLQWYAVLQLLIFLGLPLRSLLRAAEQTRGIFLGFAAAALFSVVTVIPLLKAYGLVGALAGLTGAQVAFQCVLTTQIWWHLQQCRDDHRLMLTTMHS